MDTRPSCGRDKLNVWTPLTDHGAERTVNELASAADKTRLCPQGWESEKRVGRESPPDREPVSADVWPDLCTSCWEAAAALC